MWKVGLVFVFHRLLLMTVAYFTLNQTLVPPEQRGIFAPLQPLSLVWRQFERKISEGAEPAALAHLSEPKPSELTQDDLWWKSPHPFLWAQRLFSQKTGIGRPISGIVLSNIFFLLFLSEFYALLTRIVLPEVATFTTILLVLFPTSYEMSLVSTFSLTCFLITLTLRHALDNRWLPVGLALALLLLIEPAALFLLPLTLYLFWNFQRHFMVGQVIKRTSFFLIPIVAILFWRWDGFSNLQAIFFQSGAMKLYTSLTTQMDLSWLFSQPMVGQTITAAILTVGAIGAFISNTSMAHKIIPFYMLAVLILSSSFGTIASRAPLAGVCLQGITIFCAKPIARLLVGLMLWLGCYEIVTVLS